MSRQHDMSSNRQAVRKHFGELAPEYNERNYILAGKRAKYPDLLRRHQYILGMVEDLQGRVLEVGCGSGQMLSDLLNRGFDVVGVDLTPGMIETSRSVVARRAPGKKASLFLGDIEKLGFRDESFDLVIAGGVIEYLTSDDKALRELHRVLKPGGTAILSVRNKVNVSRFATTARDLLESVPLVGAAVRAVGGKLRSWLPLSPNTGLGGRRHVPWKLKREMRAIGLAPRDYAFYHFAVLPRFLERRFPDFCIRWGERFEVFSRTPLGYLANQYIVKAQKVTDGNRNPGS